MAEDTGTLAGGALSGDAKGSQMLILHIWCRHKNRPPPEAEHFQPAGDDGSPQHVRFLAEGWLGSAAAQGPSSGKPDRHRRVHTNEAICHFL